MVLGWRNLAKVEHTGTHDMVWSLITFGVMHVIKRDGNDICWSIKCKWKWNWLIRHLCRCVAAWRAITSSHHVTEEVVNWVCACVCYAATPRTPKWMWFMSEVDTPCTISLVAQTGGRKRKNAWSKNKKRIHLGSSYLIVCYQMSSKLHQSVCVCVCVCVHTPHISKIPAT